MKKIFFPLFFLFYISSFAQVHQSLLAHLNDLPALPTSSAQALSKCTNVETGGCNSDSVVANFNAKHMAIVKALNTSMMASANTTMPDTSFVAQVKNMTPDQQRAWAMQHAMQQVAVAGAQPVKLPSAGETAFLNAYNTSITTQAAFNDSITFTWQRFTNEYDAKVKELNDKYHQQMSKCPGYNNGEGDGGLDPACVKGVEKQFQSGMESFYTDWLSRVSSFVAKKKTEMQARYGNMETLLAQNDYMSNPSNSIYKTNATTFQQTILSNELSLSQIIGDTWSKGCSLKYSVNQSEERCAGLKK